MKNFIFISPNFPTNYWLFCRELKKNGMNVLGIGDQPYDELTEDHVIPDPFDRRVAPAVAKAVASTAVETGVSRICMNEVEINALYAKRLSELS